MGFYDLKGLPLPVAYTKVPHGEANTAILDFICSRGLKLFCGFILCSSIVLLLTPSSPVLDSVAVTARQSIATEASGVTGVDVAINHVGLAFSRADIFGMRISNPRNFTSTPYFMNCDLIRAKVSWMGLFSSAFNLVEIDELTMRGLTVYVDQKVGVNSSSNAKIIMAHIDKIMANIGTDSSNLVESIVTDEKRKYIIKNTNIEQMRVHIYLNSLPVKEITVPPMVVRDIGVKQNGVSFEELFNFLVQSLSVVALTGEDNEVQAHVVKTMNRLQSESVVGLSGQGRHIKNNIMTTWNGQENPKSSAQLWQLKKNIMTTWNGQAN